MTATCIFCEILAGRAPASLVHRDATCTAFMDIRPVNPGHVLVVPNQHVAALADLPAALGGHLFAAAQTLAAALRRSGLRCEGVNLFLADGAAAGQEVFHLHLHVFPRYAGDGFGLKFSPRYYLRPGRAELDANAERIRAALDRLAG